MTNNTNYSGKKIRKEDIKEITPSSNNGNCGNSNGSGSSNDGYGTFVAVVGFLLGLLL